MRYAFLLCLLAAIGGCARYDYQLTQPPELARSISGKVETVLSRPPLEYRMQTAENRLVMRIYNTAEQPVDFLGERSYAVAPDGESHPFRNQTIAPHSFIKLILPPLRPLQPARPVFGIGVEYGSAYDPCYYGRYPAGWYDPYGSEPLYLSAAEADVHYWDWGDEATVPLHLTYQRGQEIFNHDFTFRRKKE
jgi:hypothetical protein